MEKKEKLRQLQIHPFSIRREKLPLGSLLNVTNKSILYDDIETMKKELFIDAIDLYTDISENLQYRDNGKKKLIKSLKTLRLDYPYKDFISGDERIQKKLETFQQKVDVLNKKVDFFKEAFIQEYASNKEELRKLFKENNELYESLYLVNPEIYPKLSNYLENPDTDNNKQRKLELVLMHVATRATTKTSPLGRMNRVSFLGNGKVLKYEIDKSQISVNNVFLFKVFQIFLLSDDIISQVKFKINNNHYLIGNELYIITQISNNSKVYNTKDLSIKIPMNKYLERFLQEKDISEVDITSLQKIFPLKVKELEKLLRNFHNIGLITFKEYFSDVYDSIESLLVSMGKYKIPLECKWYEVIAELQEIAKEMKELNERYENSIRQKIIQRFHRISDLTGVEKVTENEYLYEDYLVNQEEALCHEKELLGDVTQLLELYPLFDINTRIQMDVIEEMRRRYPNNTVKLNDGHIFQIVSNMNMHFSSYWYDPWGELESISETGKELEKMKQEWKMYLIEHFEEVKVNKGKKIIEIEDGFIASLKKRIPKELQNNAVSYSIFYQMQDEKMILNKIYPGYTSFYNRFLRYTDIVKNYRTRIQDFYRSDTYTMAEIYETFGFNANVYNPIFDTRIVSDLTRDEKINNDFLHVKKFEGMALKEDDGKLFLEDDTGELYKPVICTSLIRVLYPGFITFYSSLFSNISHISELASIFFRNLEEGKVLECPRIVMGDIVLERQRFLFYTSMLTGVEKLENIDAFLALRVFFKSQGIPEKFYFQSRKPIYETNIVRSISMEFNKPQYFDLENLLLLKVFLNALRTSKVIIVSEVLPENIKSCEYLTEFNLK